MTDYSEIMATKQTMLNDLNSALNNRDWVRAMAISDQFSVDMAKIYMYAEEKFRGDRPWT